MLGVRQNIQFGMYIAKLCKGEYRIGCLGLESFSQMKNYFSSRDPGGMMLQIGYSDAITGVII